MNRNHASATSKRGGYRYVIAVRDAVFADSRIKAGKRTETVAASAKASVMLHLAAHADEDGTSFASQVRLSIETGYAERGIRRILSTLEADGLITRQRGTDRVASGRRIS
jgi:DNA-binding MarR family transcriptional regulator